MKERKLVKDLLFLALIFSAVYITFQILRPGYPFSQDSIYNYSALNDFTRALLNGQFPVRWVDWQLQNGTLSQPLFSFYQVGFYYLAFLPNLILTNPSTAIKMTIILLLILGSFSVYKWTVKYGDIEALIAVLVFLLTPYLLLDIFVRSAFTEMTGLILFIPVFLLVEKIFSKGKFVYLPICSLILAGAIISHLPTVVILLPLLIIYALSQIILTKKQRIIKVFLLPGIILISLGISSFYTLPALIEREFVHMELANSGYYDFRNHFPEIQQLIIPSWGYGPSVKGLNDGMSFQIGIFHILVLLFSTYLAAVNFIRKKFKELPKMVLVLGVYYAIFFALPFSGLIWSNLPFLSYLQFPWRYLMVTVIVLPYLSAYSLSKIENKGLKEKIILIITALILFLYLPYARFDRFVQRQDIAKILQNSMPPVSDRIYLPKSVLKIDRNQKLYSLNDNNPTVKINIEKDHYYSFTTNSKEKFQFTLNVHNFPGWKAYINGNETQITEISEFAFIEIMVPAGTNKLEIRFENTPLRKIANTMTIISLVILITSYVVLLFKPASLQKNQ